MNKNKGFTLIELLVVIAIIGILASIVLASLNNARTKGNEAKVASQIAGARVAAEVYYSDHSNSYGTATAACDQMFADSTSGMLAYTTAANYPTGTTFACNSSGTAYAMYASYNSKYWCVDSIGTSVVAVTAAPTLTDQDCD